MRHWTLHPQYLDQKGLIAVWPEALLAKKVPEGNTREYIHYPQLKRFRATHDPLDMINLYLICIYQEANASV